jgi:hypothetical protein
MTAKITWTRQLNVATWFGDLDGVRVGRIYLISRKYRAYSLPSEIRLGDYAYLSAAKAAIQRSATQQAVSA